MTKYDVQVSEDKNSLAFAASDLIAQTIELTLKNKSRAKIALCGGSTPKAAYTLLGKKNLLERIRLLVCMLSLIENLNY